MKHDRAIHAAWVVALAVTLPCVAHAQDAARFPSKPLRVIVLQATGGATDIQARLFAAKMTEQLGQQFIVDNRAGGGAAAVLAFSMAAKANPDGYAMLDLAGGRIHATLANVLSSGPHVKSGKLRALGISTAQRSRVLPDLPTID